MKYFLLILLLLSGCQPTQYTTYKFNIERIFILNSNNYYVLYNDNGFVKSKTYDTGSIQNTQIVTDVSKGEPMYVEYQGVNQNSTIYNVKIHIHNISDIGANQIE